MQLTTYEIRSHIHALKLDLPVDNSVILHELRGETWLPDEGRNGQDNFPTRFRLRQLQSNILKEIEHYIEHSDFKQKILHELWKTNFGSYWGVSEEYINNITFIYGLFTKDLPGYHIRIHTDDRMHVIQGMIYFIPTDDPDQSTTFYTSYSGDNPLRITTGPGLGYFAGNTSHSWHTGKNSSTEDRYSLIFGIRLNL
jgi:hypothetical protein